MNATGKRSRPWILIAITAICMIMGAGAYHTISAGSEETYEGLKLFTDVIDIVEKNYVDEVDTKEMIESAIQGMVHGLDPHSSLLPPENFDDLKIDTKGKFTGIGIHITMRNGVVTVISPIDGTPASKAGIKAKDGIIKVDGKPVRDLREAVNLMRGPKGTKVRVTIIRKGVDEPIEMELIRDEIPIRSVRSGILQKGYGFIRLTNFTGHTTQDLVTALESFEKDETPLKGLVLDIRNNGGGLLNQAIKVSDLFLEEGNIVSIKGRQKSDNKTYKASPNEVKRDYPIVVLINGGSASASEIVAGALQDHKRAVILGTSSFGKGSVQTVETLRNGYGLKLTIALYYTPNGRSIQAKGIEPDIVVRHQFVKPDEAKKGEDLLKEKDLKNHLEAEPSEDAADDDKKDEKAKEDAEDLEKPLSKFGPFTTERLLSDNQVKRALDILTSYAILSKE